MAVVEFLPLVAVLLALVVVASAPFSRPLDRALGRVAYALFGRLDVEDDPVRRQRLRAAGIGRPYRLYVTKTYLYMAVGAVAGAVLGGYLGALVVRLFDVGGLELGPRADFLDVVPAALTTPSAKTFLVLLGASVLLGLLGAGVAHATRWQMPAIRADTRRRQIDASMSRMVAFVYALSRGGMAFPDVMRTLARNEGVFGESASEVAVGVRDIDLFGADLVTAMRSLSHRSPSDQFQTFAENLTSVLQSGRNLSGFLRDEYERFREEAEEQQAEVLELLATTAEIYVTVVVAGMLFLVTILLVIGLTGGGDTLSLIRVMTYVILPATNVLFMAYLAEVTQPLQATRESAGEIREVEERFHEAHDVGEDRAASDGGYLSERGRLNLERLRAHRQVAGLRETLGSPFAALRDDPTLLLYVTVPLALALFATHVPGLVVDGALQLRALDDALVQPVLFVGATFAVVYGYHRRYLDRLEESVPDLLERLASLNEAGVAVVTSFDRVRRSDVGTLDEEVERLWRDIQWGATVEQALERFEQRVQTPAVTRVVTLLTNAMRASNEIGPVLRIAADQARDDLRLKRKRRQEMFTYLVVIYVSFLVFLVVIGAINLVLIPSLPDTGGAEAGADAIPLAAQLGGVDAAAYQLVFFHTGLVQALFSGLVGGQMGGGSVKDGVKHATVMLAITYAVFLLFA